MWESALDGRRLHFRLAGINNQNFIMRDEETGSWWQQVSGQAIQGPLKGRRLTLVPADIVSFGIWKSDHPSGRVLAPDPDVEARGEYVPSDWEREMKRVRVVTTLPKGSAFPARTLIVGVVDGRSARAFRLDDVKQARVLIDQVGSTPIAVTVAPDGKSVRVFDRRMDGRVLELVAQPPGGLPRMIDLDTMSEWDFAGRAVTGTLAGRALRPVTNLVEYWFDWQTYHPDTTVYKPWKSRAEEKDPLEIPRPSTLVK